MTGKNHLNQINKSIFKNNNIGRPVYFKCFSSSNTKQLHFYSNSTLVNEPPNMVIVHIDSSNINKFNSSKVDIDNLTQRIIDILSILV